MPRPCRIATSTSSRPKSVSCTDASTRTSRSGYRFGEATETRNQPARHKRRPGANGQYFGRFAPLQVGCGVGELVEQNPDAVEIATARLRHHDSARQPSEQRDPEPILEYLHQPTDRIGRNIEFGAGGLKSASACGRLKCTDGVERRQSTLITEPEFCGGIAPAIWTCLPQTFPDINKERTAALLGGNLARQKARRT